MPTPADLKAENDLDAAMREEGFTDGTTPKAETPPAAAAPVATPPAAPAAPAAPGTPPTAAQKRLLKAKLDHEEKDIDFDEWAKEQWDKGRAKEVVERDFGFERRVARSAEEARAKRDAEIIADYRNRGYTFKPNPNDPSVLDIFPPSATPQVATPAAEQADPLAKEIDDLAKKLKGQETYDPDDITKLAELRAYRRHRDEQAEKDRKLQAERARAQATKQKTDQEHAEASAKQYVANFIDVTLNAHAKSFEGPNGAELREDARVIADNVARTPGKTEPDVAAAVAAYLGRIESVRRSAVTGWQASAQRGDAPPVLSGVPAGTGRAAIDPKKFDINDDAQMQAAWNEAST